MDAIDYSIIIPTFRECENLRDLIPAIDAELERSLDGVEVIVVDDNSRDGTIELCREIQSQLGLSLRLITRTEERGLATAVIHGMKAAKGKYLLVMDADFSHPVAMIPSMFHEITLHGHDFVLASRYVEGASIEGGWGIGRWLNSKGATVLAAPLAKVKDPMSGFFAFPRTLVKSWDALDPIGYKIGLELLVKCHAKNLREVPIHFANRKHGDSKLTLGQQFDYLRHLHRLYHFRYKHATRTLLFGTVGVAGTVTDFALFLLSSLWLPMGLARCIGILAAITQNFWLHQRLTFSGGPQPGVRKQYSAYLASCGMAAVANWSAFMALVAIGLRPIAAAVIGVLVAAVVNFALSSLVVFNSNFWRGSATSNFGSHSPESIPTAIDASGPLTASDSRSARKAA